MNDERRISMVLIERSWNQPAAAKRVNLKPKT
jgi:hypothetical protein